MHCRSKRGISQFIKVTNHLRSVIYGIEDTFNKPDTPISDILDFIPLCTIPVDHNQIHYLKKTQ